MSSLISVLALCVLILSNGCFTLPVSDDMTTEKTMNLRLVADDDSTILPNIESLRSIEEHMGFDITTSPVDLSGNKFVKALRTFDEFSTPSPVIVTSEESSHSKREFDDLPFTTVEPVAEVDDADRRSIENDTQIMQVETTTTINTTLPLTSTTVVPEVTTSEPFTSTSTTSSSTSTTIVPEISTSTPFTSTSSPSTTSSSTTTTTVVPEISTSTLTTVVPEISSTTPFTSTSSPSTTVVPEVSSSTLSTSTESSSTTVVPKVIPSKPFTPKSSTLNSTSKKVVPKVIPSKPFTSKSSTSTLKPITSTSTEKYVGHLEDESKFDEEYEPTTKPTKIQRKSGVLSTKKSKVRVEDKPEEKEESTVPTAVFDQQALDKVSNVPTDFLVLDESNDLIVTGLPNQTFTTTNAYKKEEEAKPLSQGEEPSYSQEKESDH